MESILYWTFESSKRGGVINLYDGPTRAGGGKEGSQPSLVPVSSFSPPPFLRGRRQTRSFICNTTAFLQHQPKFTLIPFFFFFPVNLGAGGRGKGKGLGLYALGIYHSIHQYQLFIHYFLSHDVPEEGPCLFYFLPHLPLNFIFLLALVRDEKPRRRRKIGR